MCIRDRSNVNGLVTDFSGEPLIGVSILVKGTSNGTVTDLDGKFSLVEELGISATRRVQGLGVRQREQLLEQLTK